MVIFSKPILRSLTLTLLSGWSVCAHASQGPGAGPGTASPWVQLAMAILVYGGAALVVITGLIGAMRQAR